MNSKHRCAVGFVLLLSLPLAAGCRKSTNGPENPVPELPAADPASVLLMDNFDAENNGQGVNNFSGFDKWNLVSGCVDLHGNGFRDVLGRNGLYVDLDGSCRQAGVLESKASFNLAPGGYILEFWLAGSQRPSESISDTVTVSLGTLLNERIVLQHGEAFRVFTRNVTATTATEARLRFAQTGGDNAGVLLDLIRLRRAN